MPITVRCPGCNQKLKAPDSMAGHRVRCPKCGQVMKFPSPVLDAEEVTGSPPPAPPSSSAPLPSPPPEALPAPPPISSPADGTYPLQAPAGGLAAGRFTDEDFAELNAPAPQAPAEPGRHPCPMCGEMIADGAAKCRFCKAVFDPVLRRQEEKKKRRRTGNPEDDNLTSADWLLAILCTNIGCIAGLIYLIQGKPKAGKMIGVSLLFQVVWFVAVIVIRAATHAAVMR